MYSNFLGREQLKTITRLWNQQQIKLTSACSSLHHLGHYLPDNGNPAATTGRQECTTSLVKQCRSKRFFCEDIRKRNDLEQETHHVEERSCPTFLEDADALAACSDLKKALNGEEEDAIKLMNKCSNAKELLQTLHLLGNDVRKTHLVQAIVLLWSFNKDVENQFNQPDHRQLLQRLIMLVGERVESLDLNEMSIFYLYFRKMGIDNAEPLLQELLTQSLKDIETSENFVGLPVLSRLVVAINAGRDFFTPLLCSHFLKHLEHHINACVTEEDARLIAICMTNLQPLIDDDIMTAYKVAVGNLLQTKEISASTPKTVLKILNMLNIGTWSHKHVPLIRELLLSLEPIMNEMGASELKTICRIYQYHLEPASLHASLSEAMEGLLSTNMSPETLTCFVPFALPHKREALINAYKALVSSSNSWKQPNAASHLFSTLRGLKISDVKICDTYWNGVLNELDSEPECEYTNKFLRHCHRYMNFNNNLGGTYRHEKLEKRLSQLCMRAIEHDMTGRLPKKFARLASFVLAYGHTPFCWKKYPNIILSKIINMAEQFTPIDCVVLSRGLHISLEMRYRNRVPPILRMQLATIDSVLATCMERFLSNDKPSATDVNVLVKTLSNRKNLKNSVIYHKILQKYKDVRCDELSSRSIKDMAYNFIATDYLIPEVIEAMFKYLENNHNYVTGETVEKVLTCSYNLGYTPESYESLYHAGQILLRDFNNMSGLALVQSCLALCYYKTIPEELINKVFCVKFIQRVEDEIQMCYSKATYPERVLNIVMQLNRSVCLDFPEANVPWFQQNYIEAQISKKPRVETSFGKEVKEVLSQLLKDDSCIRFNHTTPYGYNIDFVINFDKDKKLIKAPVETTMLDRITKVAILLLRLDSFCANNLNALRGPESLKMKHLEMMGYKVLHVNEHDWNSKYMNAPGAKSKYLKCLLQIPS